MDQRIDAVTRWLQSIAAQGDDGVWWVALLGVVGLLAGVGLLAAAMQLLGLVLGSLASGCRAGFRYNPKATLRWLRWRPRRPARIEPAREDDDEPVRIVEDEAAGVRPDYDTVMPALPRRNGQPRTDPSLFVPQGGDERG